MDNLKKLKFQSPHPYVLIMILIIVCALLTYIVPAGAYDRYYDENLQRELVRSESFHYIEQNPVTFFEMVQAIPGGMTEAGWIIFLVFIIGGSFGILNATGAINAGLWAAIEKLRGKDKILIFGIMALFSFGGATFGMAESTLIFIPIGVLLSRALGYDAIVGMAMVVMGASCGYTAGWMNIFNVGIAQGIAEVPLFSGMGYRLIVHAVLVIIAFAYIMRYAVKIKKNPELSPIYGLELNPQNAEESKVKQEEFTLRRKLVLIVALIGFIVLVYGITHGWSTGTQISSLFLVMGIVGGYVGGLKTNAIAEAFVDGAKELVFGALLIGVCRAMILILTNGQIIDTILHAMATPLGNLPTVVGAGLMVLVQSGINFFITSGSGMAAATMPIMAPLADLIGVSRQTAVLAYQCGDGLSNYLWPTNGLLLASLSMAKIPIDKWIKWIWKLIVCLSLAAIILVMVSVAIGYN